MAPYEERSDGKLAPPSLEEGPCDGADDQPCRIVVHDRRRRKTGPRHPLVVLRCETHGPSFTVYPPGYAPYARRPVVVLAPDGGAVGDRGEAGARFSDTAFEAAIDGARGKLWRRARSPDYAWSDERQRMMPQRGEAKGSVWSTQKRHVDRARHLLGMCVQDDEVVSFAELLGVGSLALIEGRTTHGLRAESQAICRVLDQLDQRAHDRLLAAGARAGLWPSPLIFDRSTRRLRSPFQRYGMPEAPSRSSRIRGDP